MHSTALQPSSPLSRPPFVLSAFAAHVNTGYRVTGCPVNLLPAGVLRLHAVIICCKNSSLDTGLSRLLRQKLAVNPHLFGTGLDVRNRSVVVPASKHDDILGTR